MNKIAFVCTGNTCRSPMAAGLFNQAAAQAGKGTRAISCGLAAGLEMPASPQAIEAAGAYGADISGHRSQPASVELLSGCDRIYGMTGAHVRALQAAFPQLADRVEALSGRDIQDPFGGDQGDYDRAAEEIWRAVSVLVEDAP